MASGSTKGRASRTKTTSSVRFQRGISTGQGLFCDWEKINDPDFHIFFASGHNFQSGVALTAAMMHLAGKDVPTVVDVPFRFRPVVKGICNPDLPLDASGSTRVDGDMLKAMFKK